MWPEKQYEINSIIDRSVNLAKQIHGFIFFFTEYSFDNRPPDLNIYGLTRRRRWSRPHVGKCSFTIAIKYRCQRVSRERDEGQELSPRLDSREMPLTIAIVPFIVLAWGGRDTLGSRRNSRAETQMHDPQTTHNRYTSLRKSLSARSSSLPFSESIYGECLST